LIFKALSQAKFNALRWSDLLEKTGLSPRGLKETLNSLIRDEKVARFVDANSDEYPPPVYYRATRKIKATDVWKTYMFMGGCVNALLNDVASKIEAGSDFSEAMKDFVEYLGIFFVYASWKVIEKRDKSWFDFTFPLFVAPATLSLVHKFIDPNVSHFDLFREKYRAFNLKLPNIEVDQKELDDFMLKMRKTYPLKMTSFDANLELGSNVGMLYVQLKPNCNKIMKDLDIDKSFKTLLQELIVSIERLDKSRFKKILTRIEEYLKRNKNVEEILLTKYYIDPSLSEHIRIFKTLTETRKQYERFKEVNLDANPPESWK